MFLTKHITKTQNGSNLMKKVNFKTLYSLSITPTTKQEKGDYIGKKCLKLEKSNHKYFLLS